MANLLTITDVDILKNTAEIKGKFEFNTYSVDVEELTKKEIKQSLIAELVEALGEMYEDELSLKLYDEDEYNIFWKQSKYSEDVFVFDLGFFYYRIR